MRKYWPICCGAMLGLSAAGCNDLTGSQPLPAGTPDPSSFNTPAGARGMRNAALYQFALALPQYVSDAGLLTDELENSKTGSSTGIILGSTGVGDPLDERILVEQVNYSSSFYAPVDRDYGNLQAVREDANQALGALAAYDTAAVDAALVRVLRGELYAVEGYAEVLLADFFCSGIPLSTLDFQKDYTLHAGSTQAEVYADALAKFDTALVLSVDSARILNLVRVGRGRTFADLGQYDSAAAAVHLVPDNFQYQLAVQWTQAGFVLNILNDEPATVSDGEGINGLPYRSSGDPRTIVDTLATIDGNGNPLPVPLFFPDKYHMALTGDGHAPFTVADGIEARLLEAEAQLQPASAPRGPWLATLNQLRASIGLSALLDPGTAQGRIAVLFQERAYWLFITGQRQGDLRRLIRQYGPTYPQFRQQNQVYPTGAYLAPGTGVYGNDVNAPIPAKERSNHLFHGCLNRAP